MCNKDLFNDLSEETKVILSILQKKQIASKEDLLQETGYKSTSINRLLNQLKESGLILQCGKGESIGGRKPLLYSLNPEKRIFCLGINLGLIHIDIALMHFTGKIMFMKIINTSKDISPREAIDLIKTELEQKLSEHGIDKDEIYMGGLSVFCAIDRGEGTVVGSFTTTFTNPTWSNFPIRHELEKALTISLVMDTTVNACCIGEYLFGYGKNAGKICTILCSNNIRLSSIHNGTIIRPVNSLGDAFGHMVVSIGGERCICGNYGCLDTYATVPAIMKNFISGIKRGRASILKGKDVYSITQDDIMEAAEQKDPLAMEVVSEAATYLGSAVANYVNLFAPEVFACAGYLIEKSPLYYSILQDVVREKISYIKNVNNVVFTQRSDMGRGVAGASIMAVEALFDNYY